MGVSPSAHLVMRTRYSIQLNLFDRISPNCSWCIVAPHLIELVHLPISVNVVFTSVLASSAIVPPLSWNDISSFLRFLKVRNDGA